MEEYSICVEEDTLEREIFHSISEAIMSIREFFINVVRMVDIDGSTNIPTVLYYGPKGTVFIGSSALASARNLQEINAEFKVDLGNIDPVLSLPPKRVYRTANGNSETAIGLAGDFINKIIQFCDRWFEENEITECANIMVAEPLMMQTGLVSSDWLSIYRKNIKRLLTGKQLIGKHFEHIEFLPEPFAVFQ